VGAIIGASYNNALPGAVLGALVIGPAEAITDGLRRPGDPKPFIYRLLMMSLTGVVVGSLLSMLFTGLSLTTIGIIIGFLSGINGLRINKILLGLISGGAIGFLAQVYFYELDPAIIGALIVLIDRSLSAVLFRGQEEIQVMAKRVPRNEIKYFVPFEANSKYVGADI
jgi:uncharacterized membrane protein